MPQGPLYGTRNDPVGRIARWATWRVTCHQKCNRRRPREAGKRSLSRCFSGRRVEAEGFEPPGGCPPLAVKAGVIAVDTLTELYATTASAGSC